jgi:hypothetical protein
LHRRGWLLGLIAGCQELSGGQKNNHVSQLAGMSASKSCHVEFPLRLNSIQAGDFACDIRK